jgi:hypothetical protein
LPDNVEIELAYLGDNIFEVFQINEIMSPDRAPSFHSRSLIPTLTANFDIELTPLNIDVPKLVSRINYLYQLCSVSFYLNLSVCIVTVFFCRG